MNIKIKTHTIARDTDCHPATTGRTFYDRAGTVHAVTVMATTNGYGTARHAVVTPKTAAAMDAMGAMGDRHGFRPAADTLKTFLTLLSRAVAVLDK